MRSRKFLAKNLIVTLQNHPKIGSKAALAREAMISQSTVHRVLLANSKISLDTLDKIASALQIDPADLLRSDFSFQPALQLTNTTERPASRRSSTNNKTDNGLVTTTTLALLKPPSLLQSDYDVKQSPFRHLFWSTKQYTTVKNVINVVLSNPTFELVTRCVKYFGLNNVQHELDARRDEFNSEILATFEQWLVRIEKGAALALKNKKSVEHT